MNNWISVDDELPEEFTPVLLLLDETIPWQGMYEGGRDKYKDWALPFLDDVECKDEKKRLLRIYSYCLEKSESKVTHWQPLPDGCSKGTLD